MAGMLFCMPAPPGRHRSPQLQQSLLAVYYRPALPSGWLRSTHILCSNLHDPKAEIICLALSEQSAMAWNRVMGYGHSYKGPVPKYQGCPREGQTSIGNGKRPQSLGSHVTKLAFLMHPESQLWLKVKTKQTSVDLPKGEGKESVQESEKKECGRKKRCSKERKRGRKEEQQLGSSEARGLCKMSVIQTRMLQKSVYLG